MLPPGPRYVDPDAAATGELIFELAAGNGWPVTEAVARALYVAILTDTGGFRFSNTRPRTLRVAADLLEAGVDPEQIYLEVYARAPEGRPRLLAEALQTLVVEPEYGLAWVTVPPGVDRAARRLVRRSRWRGRVSPLDRGRPDGAAVPGDCPGESQGVAPLGGRRRCGRVRQGLRWRRTHQSGGTFVAGIAGGRPVDGAEGGAGVPGVERRQSTVAGLIRDRSRQTRVPRWPPSFAERDPTRDS